jgi:hypothetical protein
MDEQPLFRTMMVKKPEVSSSKIFKMKPSTEGQFASMSRPTKLKARKKPLQSS